MTVTFKIQGVPKKKIILKAIILETTECSSMKLSSLGVERQKFIKLLACEMMSPCALIKNIFLTHNSHNVKISRIL